MEALETKSRRKLFKELKIAPKLEDDQGEINLISVNPVPKQR
jgi:hypothetical protein